MKITYISDSIIPSRTANSIHVMKMCQAFAKNGHEVTLLAPDRRRDYEADVVDVFAYYGVDRIFNIVKQPWLRIRGRGYLYGALAALNAHNHKPDVVFGRNTVGCTLAAFMGLPVIYESHSPIAENGVVINWLFNRLLHNPRLKKLVVITHSLREYYEVRYPHITEKIFVAPDGADPVPPDAERIPLPHRDTRLQVGYAGHLYKGKGMEILAELAKVCEWADFNVVGGARSDIVRWENKVSLPNLFMWGHVPHSQVKNYLLAFDILLLPNQRWVSAAGSGDKNISQWTSPLKAFEYMSVRKPIITSDLPALREVFEHERNALLCDPEDISEWKNALERIRHDIALRETIADSAHCEFLQKYTWQSRANMLLHRCM